MVKLTQIDDETFEKSETFSATKPETSGAAASDSEDSESDSDIEDEFDFDSETVYDRIVALKDIIDPEQREYIASATSSLKSYVNYGLNKTGSLLWTVTSSALLLGVPLSLAIIAETQLQEMEKDLSLQQSAQEVLAPGSEGAFAEKTA
ncbi:mitochondrial outer membrane translocase complex, subunit Tom22 [Scheffersomyces xylosifermentans]|uniref:mitochondrial outer membrane translocase complex, subunit Tom22 n=1 Tax=Scheffersomyces xylosifermentans TaxID=1304137 RepID=UPI00315CFBD8